MLPGIGATVAHPDAPRAQESGFAQLADNYNHLSSFSYDFAGNTSNDGVNGYLWNAESDLKTAAGVNYLYDAPFASRMILRDGDGRRAAKANSANPPVPYKLYWYGPGGEILAETDGSNNILNEYVFFGGKRVALLPAGSTAQFYAEDMLGSTRIVTTNTGVVCYDADSYPYGGERTALHQLLHAEQLQVRGQGARHGNRQRRLRRALLFQPFRPLAQRRLVQRSRRRSLRQPHQPANPQPLRHG